MSGYDVNEKKDAGKCYDAVDDIDEIYGANENEISENKSVEKRIKKRAK